MRDGDTGTYLGELVIKCGMEEEAGDWGKLYLKGLCLVGLHITHNSIRTFVNALFVYGWWKVG